MRGGSVRVRGARGGSLVAGRAVTLPAKVTRFGWYACSSVSDGIPIPVGGLGPKLRLAASALRT